MSTIENAKRSMGWVAPQVRPACGNCDHVDVELGMDPGNASYRCRAGGFWTARFAICERHVPLRLTGGARG